MHRKKESLGHGQMFFPCMHACMHARVFCKQIHDSIHCLGVLLPHFIRKRAYNNIGISVRILRSIPDLDIYLTLVEPQVQHILNTERHAPARLPFHLSISLHTFGFEWTRAEMYLIVQFK